MRGGRGEVGISIFTRRWTHFLVQPPYGWWKRSRSKVQDDEDEEEEKIKGQVPPLLNHPITSRQAAEHTSWFSLKVKSSGWRGGGGQRSRASSHFGHLSRKRPRPLFMAGFLQPTFPEGFQKVPGASRRFSEGSGRSQKGQEDSGRSQEVFRGFGFLTVDRLHELAPL